MVLRIWNTNMELIYCDRDIVVCTKPPRVLSTDEPGGLPELVRQALGDPNTNIRTVHRLDRVVSGLMVLARSKKAASELSRQIREGQFEKEYLAVLHGIPQGEHAVLQDLLLRSKEERKTYVVSQPGKDVQEAALEYWVLARTDDLSKVRIRLITGRTHQIRAQFPAGVCPWWGIENTAPWRMTARSPCGRTPFVSGTPIPGSPWNLRQNPPPGIPGRRFRRIAK